MARRSGWPRRRSRASPRASPHSRFLDPVRSIQFVLSGLNLKFTSKNCHTAIIVPVAAKKILIINKSYSRERVEPRNLIKVFAF